MTLVLRRDVSGSEALKLMKSGFLQAYISKPIDFGFFESVSSRGTSDGDNIHRRYFPSEFSDT